MKGTKHGFLMLGLGLALGLIYYLGFWTRADIVLPAQAYCWGDTLYLKGAFQNIEYVTWRVGNQRFSQQRQLSLPLSPELTGGRAYLTIILEARTHLGAELVRGKVLRISGTPATQVALPDRGAADDLLRPLPDSLTDTLPTLLEPRRNIMPPENIP